MEFHLPYRCRASALLIAIAFAAQAQNLKGRVTRIIDGDTVEILLNSSPIIVRLNGIDAPEKDQMFGTRARQVVSELAFGKQVGLILHERERYNRIVADVILPDGRNLSHELVRGGAAWWFRRYAPHDEKMRLLEEEARDAKRGLWADPSPMPPWEFRKLSK